ncbi:MAG: hypothetical protein PHC64_09595 [Candidatus Gastranaerophilales bacterium]|nr:hypothetical protein [Candidatus Gastranaerophilales bacterium]
MNKILDTLHSQFAENQNHHQGIFIQFLIALFAIFGVFGYIYTHTSSEISAIQTVVGKINDIELYSLITLLITSVIVLAILTLLIAIILNLGYGFRRDQHLNKKIRQKYLTNGEYEDIFGKLYNSDNKNICDFLPDFYKIFYWFILGFQIIIFLTTCFKENILQFENNSFAFLMLLLDFSLILVSVCLYYLTYRKYKDKLKNAER